MYDLLQLINELKLAGAEAIEINGVRIVNKSDIALITDSFIKIDGHRMNSPYVVKAIGNPTTLESGLMQKNSGYIDKVINQINYYISLENLDTDFKTINAIVEMELASGTKLQNICLDSTLILEIKKSIDRIAKAKADLS